MSNEKKVLQYADMQALADNPAQARHVAGQTVMRDPRAAQLLALFEMSDERGKITLLAIAGIHAARYPKGE